MSHFLFKYVDEINMLHYIYIYLNYFLLQSVKTFFIILLDSQLKTIPISSIEQKSFPSKKKSPPFRSIIEESTKQFGASLNN